MNIYHNNCDLLKMSAAHLDYDNPYIELILPNGNLNPSYLDDEILINRLHFIWLGSALTPTNSKNIPKWIVINKDCQMKIFIWYDTLLLDDQEMNQTRSYLEHLQQLTSNTVYLCDVNHYNLFQDDQLFDAYQYELGIRDRPGINPLAREIRNYGMASDVLRMCILKHYGGFYMDLDMTPTNLCIYHRSDRIKSCPLRFCIAISETPQYHSQYLRNMYENYDNYYDYRSIYGNEVFEDEDEDYTEYALENGMEQGIINNGLYYDPSTDNKGYIDRYFELFKSEYRRIIESNFYGYFLDFRGTTIKVSGPGVFSKLFTKYDSANPELSSRKAILRDIIEDSEQSTHSWLILDKHLDVFTVLLYELLQNIDLIDLSYEFMRPSILYSSDNESLEYRIDYILSTYISSVVDNKITTMYSSSKTFVMIINHLVDRIISKSQPSISLYLDLIRSLRSIPGPYIFDGCSGNYTEQERQQTDDKFKQYVGSFIARHVKV